MQSKKNIFKFSIPEGCVGCGNFLYKEVGGTTGLSIEQGIILFITSLEIKKLMCLSACYAMQQPLDDLFPSFAHDL
jgi:hypothetical protein